eukprot:TRINITY_DN569_c0_g1_i1.p1 TRINITY_DN569_c0_g1~~TRINITY_DN569_c0_g1_i1.p1  ORF type:complete len:254 (+),score=118.83 TRINITY_DN569_c0_g1_i1:55-816(+)
MSLYGGKVNAKTALQVASDEFRTLNITNAALASTSGSATLSLILGGEEFVLGTVKSGSTEQFSLDVVIEPSEKSYYFNVKGDGEIHLTGYYMLPQMPFGESFDDEGFSDDEEGLAAGFDANKYLMGAGLDDDDDDDEDMEEAETPKASPAAKGKQSPKADAKKAAPAAKTESPKAEAKKAAAPAKAGNQQPAKGGAQKAKGGNQQPAKGGNQPAKGGNQQPAKGGNQQQGGQNNKKRKGGNQGGNPNKKQKKN